MLSQCVISLQGTVFPQFSDPSRVAATRQIVSTLTETLPDAERFKVSTCTAWVLLHTKVICSVNELEEALKDVTGTTETETTALDHRHPLSAENAVKVVLHAYLGTEVPS